MDSSRRPRAFVTLMLGDVTMALIVKSLLITTAVLVSTTTLLVFSPNRALAVGSENFCGTWLRLCNKTCPEGPGKCERVCAQRYKGCRTSGCFFFNVPGPRCEGNSNDEIATAKTRDRLQKGLPVGCGPRFGRPCDP